ncbi:hypothetical protein HWV62_36119 [Athelia sp. TMB]|nr:hypothetical protein HWV62_36119 [Athelia sp. TMB]
MSSRLIASSSARASLFSVARRHATAVPKPLRWSPSRNAHIRRELAYPIEKGLGEFLPPAALKTLAVEYQDGLLQRLNDEVRGGPEEGRSVAQTVIDTAPDPTKTLAFNYASEALNNSFFLDFLKPLDAHSGNNHEASISSYLGTAIRHYEGSIDHLKSRVSATAMGMTGSGYVWFVCDQRGHTAVIPTYGAGTLLVRSRTQQTPVNGPVIGEGMKTPGIRDFSNPSAASVSGTSASSPASGLAHGSAPLHPSSPARALHSSAPASLLSKPSSVYSPSTPSNFSNNSPHFDHTTLGETLFPLFCVSVHERSWMAAGYGVWGKEEWLKQFWTVLDWAKVSEAYAKFVPDSTQMM